MSGFPDVMRAFDHFREAAQPFVLAQSRKHLPAASQHFMYVCLMPDIPNQLVLGTVEHVVQSKRQLHYSEVGRKVAACLGERLDEKLPDFGCQRM